LPGKRQPGEASPVAPPLPARRFAPYRRRLPPRLGQEPETMCRHCCQARKKPPEKSGGRDRRRKSCPRYRKLQLLKSLAGLPSRGAVTPDAAPMAEWGRRPSGAIVSLSAGKQWQGMGYGTRFPDFALPRNWGRKLPPDPLFLSSVFRHIVCHICFHLTKVLCLGCSASRAGRARRKRPPPKKQFLKIKPQVRGLFFLHSSDQ
jgi:hypothetical protein